MHGGDIYRNDIEYDFSISINMLNMFNECRGIFDNLQSILGVYPDINKDELREVIARRFNADKELIVCTNGASELIHAICLCLKAKKALLNIPCFSGYERYLKLSGTEIITNSLMPEDEFALKESIINAIYINRPDIIFITNPNNPDGNLVNPFIRKEIVRAVNQINALLVVDECFIELTDENESASFLNEHCSNMVVIRALTKSYAMPGVRLGYGICSSAKIKDMINAYLPEWNLSMLSQQIGCQLIGQESYLEKSRKIIKSEREYLIKELKKLDFTVYPSRSNFILFKDEVNENKCKVEKLYDYLINRKILIRDCSDFKGLKKGYYRIAVKNHDANECLINNIKEYRRQ